MKLIQIWTPGNTKIGSGYRTVWVLQEGKKWTRIFDALNNDHVKIRPSQLKDMFVKDRDINLRYWVMFLADKIHINKHYKDILKWISTLNRDMDTQILTELLFIKETCLNIERKLKDNEAEDKYAEVPFLGGVTKPTKPFIKGVAKVEKKTLKELKKLYPPSPKEKKKRGRPPGAKGKKK